MGQILTYEADYKTFLNDCDELASCASKSDYDSHSTTDEKSFRGMGLDEIKASRFGYKKGLEKIKKLNAGFSIGSKKIQYKWDEFDGDDMSMERMYDGFAPMRKRHYQLGNGSNGKFITLNISICEAAFVTADQLLCRAAAALQLIDYLESLNYRIAVNVYADLKGVGKNEEGQVDQLFTKIMIKKENEPLIKPLLATCISPWMFRYHFFKFLYSKFATSWGLGQPIQKNYEDTPTEIYIRTGECLNEDTVKAKFKEIEKRYS